MFTSIKDWKNSKNKINEGNSYDDFLATYMEKLKKAADQVEDIATFETDDEELLAKLQVEVEKALKPYDKNILDFLHRTYNPAYQGIAKFAIENQDKYGTEPQMVLLAIEDVHKVYQKLGCITKSNENLSDTTNINKLKSLFGDLSEAPEDIQNTHFDELAKISSKWALVARELKSGNINLSDNLIDAKDISDNLDAEDISKAIEYLSKHRDPKESVVNEANGSFAKLKFNSHTWHNPYCDILEGHLDSESFITYGVYVKDDSSHKIGDEFMEYYKGPLYVSGSKSPYKSNSRMFTVDKIPTKYKDKWKELKTIYEKQYKGKGQRKLPGNGIELYDIDEAYTFDFEDFMDSDISGPAIESKITMLIDETIDLVNKEIDAEGAGSGANLEAVKQQAYKEIARVWKNKIEDYLVKGIKFNK